MNPLLQQWVTAQAEHRPDATALVMNKEPLTYGELEESTNQLASLLKEAGCEKGDRICFLIPKSPAAIVSILGILKADCVYVPLDTSSPAPRVAHMIQSCEPRWILAVDAVTPLLDELSILLADQLRSSISIGWMDPQE
ncbi:MAG: AMP-binding protein, partial [Terriglobia bacterium]